MKLLAAVALSLLGGCNIPDHFVCHASAQCGSDGTCVDGTCAFPDPQCSSGLRLLDADCVLFTPPHLGTTTIGSGDLVLTSGTIDTKVPTLGTLPAGVSLTIEPQTTGPELAVLHARTVTVPANAVVGVIGTRPLVIVALSIDIAGALDVGARATSPGAGLPSTGPGTGADGKHTNSFTDSGAGGGGLGTVGANGGDASCSSGSCVLAAGGAGGQTSGDALTGPLVPGFSGGDSVAACGTTFGGAGGGALQLSAVASITIAGYVLAGGGGGGGGVMGSSCNYGAGGGGGSGGMIVIDAAQISITGVVAANGGAGGSGASASPQLAGNPGADGGASATPAAGGMPVGTNNTTGGNGAAGATIATAGGSNTTRPDDNYNGGGGGGGIGRIALIGSAATTGSTISPAPVMSSH